MAAASDACSATIAVRSDDADNKMESSSNESEIDELEDAAEAVRTTANDGLNASLSKEKQLESIPLSTSLLAVSEDGSNRRVMIVQGYSNFGFNKLWNVASKDPQEQERGQSLIKDVLDQDPRVVQNILGFVPAPEHLRHFLLDGCKGNRHCNTIEDLACGHIPQGSKASEYIAAYATLRPTDVIVIGQRGDGACFQSIVEKHTRMHKVVPDCQYHYLTYFDGEHP